MKKAILFGVAALLVATVVTVAVAVLLALVTTIVAVAVVTLLALITAIVAITATVIVTALRTTLIATSIVEVAAAITTAEQLKILGNDANATAALAGLLVFPCVHLQATFDEYGATLAQVLSCNLAGATPAGYVKESGLFAALALIGAAGYAVNCQTKFGKGVAAGGLANLGVGGEVADEHDFVQISHNRECVI